MTSKKIAQFQDWLKDFKRPTKKFHGIKLTTYEQKK